MINTANIRQDRLAGIFFHPEFHFDNSRFDETRHYQYFQEQIVLDTIRAGNQVLAWQAFGRWLHASQDFYAHSNYVTLWLERQARDQLPDLDDIDPLDPEILANPSLVSAGFYPIYELIYRLPGMSRWISARMPADAHALVNLDSPDRGDLFFYAAAAARKRTLADFQSVLIHLTSGQARLFRGVAPAPP